MNRERFTTPSTEMRPIPKWVWNAKLEDITPEAIEEQMRGFRDEDGYGGLMIVLWGYPGYESEEYFKKYGEALELARKYGLSIILWDENGFPSGYAGGLIGQKYPEFAAQRLDMSETAFSGPRSVMLVPPEGKFLGAVALNTVTYERIDVSLSLSPDGSVAWEAPAGDWVLMAFSCAIQKEYRTIRNGWPLVNYLDREAVAKFIGVTHQTYFNRFPHFFGSTIKYAFYDEPSFWHIKGGRIWTEKFNEKFILSHGYDPITDYPALWRDIGPDTASARASLFGFRAELYSREYVKTLADWCHDHRILLTGHMDQEEIISPVPISGDLMKSFEFQDIPGVDEIGFFRRGSKAYKIVSSAARNYDKSRVMCEVFGAMGEKMPTSLLLKEAMDLYAKGVNFMVPHGTWYENTKDVTFPPELSYRSAKFGPYMAEYNLYCARCSEMLTGGRNVADICILYPIDDLQAAYRFGPENAYTGGANPVYSDYLEIGEMFSLDLHRDFMFLHPEVFEEKCGSEGNLIILGNDVNRESFSVMVLPGMKTISARTVKKVRAFFESGGQVIATGCLPDRSSERGFDYVVTREISAIFGEGENSSIAGGTAVFMPYPDRSSMAEVLDRILSVPDMRIDVSDDQSRRNISAIHKVKDNRNVYFIANSGEEPVDLKISIKGSFQPELWDPHTGGFEKTYFEEIEGSVKISLKLQAVHSVFIVEGE